MSCPKRNYGIPNLRPLNRAEKRAMRKYLEHFNAKVLPEIIAQQKRKAIGAVAARGRIVF